MDLILATTDHDGVAVVSVSGEVDVYTAPQLRSALDEQISVGRTRLVVDMSEVGFVDSTGLGVLVGRLKLVRAHGGWLRLVCTDERTLRVFNITGLDKVFSIHETVDSALEAPAPTE